MAFVVNFGNMSIVGAIGTYFFTYNLERPDMIPVFMLINVASVFVGIIGCQFIQKSSTRKTSLLPACCSVAAPSVSYVPELEVILVGSVIGGVAQDLPLPLSGYLG